MTFLHDDRLRLIHLRPPGPAHGGPVALTLKVVAGLSTEAIAQAFLTTEATMGQRAAPGETQDHPRWYPLSGAGRVSLARTARRGAGRRLPDLHLWVLPVRIGRH